MPHNTTRITAAPGRAPLQAAAARTPVPYVKTKRGAVGRLLLARVCRTAAFVQRSRASCIAPACGRARAAAASDDDASLHADAGCDSKRLSEKLAQCASADSVLAVVASCLEQTAADGAARLDEAHVVAALSTLATHAPPQPQGWADDARLALLLSAAEAMLCRMQPPSLAAVLRACGVLRAGLSPRFRACYLEATAPLLERFNAEELSNTLYAYGQLFECEQVRGQPPAAWQTSYWRASVAALETSTLQGLCLTLYACGELRITPPAEWLLPFWKTSAPALGDLDEQALANTLRACGQLRITPPAEWLTRFWASSAAVLGHCSSQHQLCTMVYACGRLGITPPTEWLTLFWGASAALLGQFTPQNLSKTIHACGLVPIMPPADWLLRFWEVSYDELPHFTPQGLSLTLRACGPLHATPPAEWLLRFWDVSAPVLPEITPWNLCDILHWCAMRKLTPSRAWLAQFWGANATAMPRLNQQDLSSVLYSCGQLGAVPPSWWLTRYWRASAAVLGKVSPQGLSSMLYGCGMLCVVPPASWLQAYWTAFDVEMHRFDAQTCVNTLFAVAMLAAWDTPVLGALWTALLAQLDSRLRSAEHSSTTILLCQLYHVYIIAAAEQPFVLEMPPKLLQTARQAWHEQSKSSTTISGLHESVSATLMAMGTRHTNEHWCERSEHSIDIVIITEEPASRIALEVDGPLHFMLNGDLNGTTRMRNRFLRAHGWRLEVVDFRKWNALETHPEREQYLAQLLA